MTLQRKKPMRSRVRATGPSNAVVDVCLDRAQHSCEVCGGMIGYIRGVDWSTQHRIPRGMGGSRHRPDLNEPPNILIVCGNGTELCHGVIESFRAASYRAGWLVHRNVNPAEVPVLIERGTRWVLLTADGRYRDVPAPARGEGFGESEAS